MKSQNGASAREEIRPGDVEAPSDHTVCRQKRHRKICPATRSNVPPCREVGLWIGDDADRGERGDVSAAHAGFLDLQWVFDGKVGYDVEHAEGHGEAKKGEEFVHFIGDDIRLDPVMLDKEMSIEQMLQFYMGKNTPDRQKFIIENLKVELDLVEE